MRKIFQFAIECNGVIQFLVQEAKFPKVTLGKVLHGASNYDVKTAGGVEVGDAQLRGIKPSEQGETSMWDWLNQAQDMNTGKGQLDAVYKRDLIFKEMSPAGVTLNAWLWEGCFPIDIDRSDYKRGNKNENMMETTSISIDRVKKII